MKLQNNTVENEGNSLCFSSEAAWHEFIADLKAIGIAKMDAHDLCATIASMLEHPMFDLIASIDRLRFGMTAQQTARVQDLTHDLRFKLLYLN